MDLDDVDRGVLRPPRSDARRRSAGPSAERFGPSPSTGRPRDDRSGRDSAVPSDRRSSDGEPTGARR